MPTQPTKIEISAKTIVFTVVFLLFLQVLWIVRSLLISLFIAFMIMSIVKPVVSRMSRYKIPRTLSALLVFIVLFGVLGTALSYIIPPLISDMTVFFRTLPRVANQLTPVLGDYFKFESLDKYFPTITNQAFGFIRGLFSNIVFVITTLFFSFYFVVQENFIEDFVKRFFDDRQAQRVSSVFDTVERRMSSWFWGELVLMSVIGVITYLGLTIIGVRHALSLAVIAGLFEIIPILGPILSGIPAFIFGVNQSPALGVYVVALYILIQQMENNLLVPVVMRRAVGLNKIIILMMLIIGGKLAGIAGLFLAIPLTLFVETILVEVMKGKQSS